MILQLFAFIIFYLIGCFPSGIIISKFNNIDITKHGSGNIGATNIARNLGAKAGLLTLLFDVVKGMLALLIATILSKANFIDYSFIPFAGSLVVAGHCFSIPTKLKGGKGVATALGVIIYLAPLLSLIALLVFILTFLLGKYVSLASILATGIVAILSLVLGYSNNLSQALGIIAIIIIYRHKDNIKRLVRGEEEKFKSKKLN